MFRMICASGVLHGEPLGDRVDEFEPAGGVRLHDAAFVCGQRSDPHGLAGDDIPLEAQVVSIADVFDALTSVRPYKPEWAIQAALHEHLDEVRLIHARFHEDGPAG